MKKTARIINPVMAGKTSGLYAAQPLTFAIAGL